jgi:hypothetical protein
MMINFNINREDFIDQKKLGVVRIENQIEDIHINHMEILINYFKQEYSWDKMFKLEDVFNRLKEGHTLFILFSNKSPLGYVWFNKLDNEIAFLYNLYVTNRIKRPKLAPIWFVNETCSQMLGSYSSIKCECEDWNTHAQRIFTSNNFSVSN